MRVCAVKVNFTTQRKKPSTKHRYAFQALYLLFLQPNFKRGNYLRKRWKSFLPVLTSPSVCGKKKNSPWPVLLPVQISCLVDNIYILCLFDYAMLIFCFHFMFTIIYCFPEFVSLHSAVSGIHLGWKSESWWLLYDSNYYYNNNTNTNNNNDNIIVILYKSIPRIFMFCSALSSALLKTPTKLQQSFP